MLLVLDVSVILSLLLACNPNTTVEPLPTIVGPDGGQVVSGGVVLDIPEGALDAPVVIQLVDTGMAAPAPYDGLSTVWAIEPAGLVFSQPVQLQIPYDTRDSVPRFFWSDGAGGYASLEASFADGVATASIDRLSRGFVAARPVETIEFDTHIAPMDVLFVIDDSCSMAEEQARLAGGFASMLEALDAAQLDYHLGVVSTEMDDASQAGKLRQVSGERFITPTTDNALNTLSYMANLGTNGAEQEKGRAAALRSAANWFASVMLSIKLQPTPTCCSLDDDQ